MNVEQCDNILDKKKRGIIEEVEKLYVFMFQSEPC